MTIVIGGDSSVCSNKGTVTGASAMVRTACAAGATGDGGTSCERLEVVVVSVQCDPVIQSKDAHPVASPVSSSLGSREGQGEKTTCG